MQQVTVGSVDFHTINARIHRAARSGPELFDDTRDLFRLQRTWNWRFGLPFESVHSRPTSQRAGSLWLLAFQQVRMGHPTTMHNLHENETVVVVHLLGNPLPAILLLLSFDSCLARECARTHRRKRTLGDDQTCRSSL